MPVAVRLAPPRARSFRDRAIAPFTEGPPGMPLLGVSLKARQNEMAARAGFSVEDAVDAPAGAAMAFDADALFSSATLEALARAAASAGHTVRGAVAAGSALFDFMQPLVEGTTPDADLPLPLWAGPDLSSEARARAPLAVVCDETDHVVRRTAPFGIPPHALRIPRVTRLGGRLTHWVHVLNANLAWLMFEKRQRGAEGARNVRGKKVKVHRTALVEGSILEDGAEIEAGASVVDSYIGRGVKIAPHSVMHTCVIGDGCHTLLDTHLRRVVAMEGSTLSNMGSEDLLLGREIFITTGVSFYGSRRGEDVVLDGHDTRRAVLGAAIGHGCILGARALFGEPVALPGGTVVVGRPDEAVQKLDQAGLARAGAHLGDRARDA